MTPVIFYDANVPGLPYRTPTANPTRLELAQVREYQNFLARQPTFDVQVYFSTEKEPPTCLQLCPKLIAGLGPPQTRTQSRLLD